jgi:hypothetical protein
LAGGVAQVVKHLPSKHEASVAKKKKKNFENRFLVGKMRKQYNLMPCPAPGLILSHLPQLRTPRVLR